MVKASVRVAVKVVKLVKVQLTLQMVNKMGRRTLQASSVGIQKIKKTMKRKRWSQDLLNTFSSAQILLTSPQILLKEELQALFTKLPDPQNEEQFEQWWKENGKTWAEKLRQIMITYRNIGHDWQFNRKQKDLLEKYRTANILLMECLGREAVIDRGVRAEIENTLFLPISN